uniref:Desmoplakin b n=1 Tax=Dicentrarchus labrax TaxID=13489 RepID=A0A8C4NKB0_DICLA
MGWIAQQKRLIETASWGDDAATIQQQLISHQKFHSSIQRSHEVDRARDDLLKKGDKGNLYHLEQEWDSLQQMSFGRTQQLQDLQQIIQEMSQEIMWVNGKEEEELMFDWGDKNIDQYIPRKQESYSKLMSALEDKEKDLNKLKAKVDTLLKNNHPASDKIEAYKDTLQTQWSWLLQITKCIDVHLKENAAYNQFFKEANETYSNLQKEHETVRKNFTCDKNTSLEDLLELLRGLEREKEKIMENKRQVSHLVNRSKSIVRLKPRNPEEKSGSTVIVKALCDFKQDHKVICKDNEAILKDNSQRSKWDITGPGGLDMSVPSVCLIVPPPNPLSVSLANKNEQYYEAILSIWNQLYINVKSLIAWQYCLLDIRHINSLTISMLAKMRPEEYRQIMKNLETHFQEFKVSCHGSQMFVDEDKRAMENQFNGAQAHYDRLVVQLPTYSQYYRNTYYKETDSDILISHIICKIYMYSFSFFHLATIISLSIRLQALRNMLESVAQAEDIVKVHEARLTEKETTSLSPSEVEDYMLTLKNIKAELDQKKDILASMEAELAKASHWNGQVDGPFQRCDLMLSKYTDQVSLLSDRWRRLYGQIDTRIQDLQLYQPQLQHYKKTSVSLIDWIDATRKKQDALQATKIDNIQTSHIFILLCFKALNSEIKLRRETVESVLKDNEACVNSIKDYETDLASYTSGLETLLNIPIKRTMLRSPTMDLNQEATQLQTHYMELLTWSGDYYKFLGELLKNMEELKTTATMQSIKSQYNEIVMERDALLMKLKLSESDRDRLQKLEEELSHIKLSLETELRSKQRIQEENERMKRDLGYWKDQYESKQGLIRQCDTDKERLEREKSSLKTEIERLMRELRELEESYKSKLSAIQKELREVTIVRQTMETELKRAKEPPPLDGSTVIFDGVRKSVTANQLLDCGVLDKPTFSQLVKGHKTVPDVSVDKKISLKGTGPIAGVVIEGPKGPGSITGVLCKMTLTEAKRENLLPPDSVGLLLDAQAATGHIIDPKTNKKLTVEEALNQGVIDEEDRERLLAAEAAAVGYSGPGTSKPLSVFEAMKRGLIDKNTALRLLQAQESVGGILDPILSVFLPKDTAIERNLIDDDIYRALNQRPELYLDPESEDGVTYMSMKRRCKVELHTGLLLLPIPEKVDPSKLVFDGVRKPVTAKQLVDCGVLDKPSFKDLEKGKKTVPEVSVDKNVNLKGTGPIAGVIAGSQGKMSLSEAKKKMLLPEDSADLLLEAQAATGHIIDPRTNQKLTVEEACTRGVVDIRDRDKLLAAEAAAVGYKDPRAAKPLSVFEAMKKGIIDRKTGLRLLQAQESVGGILDPNLSVFLPKDTAIKRNLLDENLRQALNQSPECYLDPETEQDATYGALKKRCKTEPHTGLLLLPITEKLDPSTLIFDGVRKPVTAQQLLDCGVLDKPTFNQLMKGEKTVPEVTSEVSVPPSVTSSSSSSSSLLSRPLSPTLTKMTTTRTTTVTSGAVSSLSRDSPDSFRNICSVSISLAAPVETVCEQEPVGAIFDTEALEKISITEAKNRGLVDSITAQRLLEAQACTGGIINPTNGQRFGIKEASRLGIINEDMVALLKPAQKAYIGFEDVKTRKKMSAAEALKEMWLPYEAGMRFMEFQYITGGLYDPEKGCRRSIEDALKMGWLDGRAAQKLQDTHHIKILTCPKSKLKISYKEALDNCMVEEKTGVKMLQASSVSSRGISSPYNVSSAPGSSTGSRSGSRRSSRRSSVDLGSPSSFSSANRHFQTSYTSYTSTK